MQHAIRVRHIGNCCLSDSTVFLPVIHETNFGGKKIFLNIEYVLIFSTTLPEIFSHSNRTKRDIIINAAIVLVKFK
jgi:hypothetical protein